MRFDNACSMPLTTTSKDWRTNPRDVTYWRYPPGPACVWILFIATLFFVERSPYLQMDKLIYCLTNFQPLPNLKVVMILVKNFIQPTEITTTVTHKVMNNRFWDSSLFANSIEREKKKKFSMGMLEQKKCLKNCQKPRGHNHH